MNADEKPSMSPTTLDLVRFVAYVIVASAVVYGAIWLTFALVGAQ